MKADALFPYTTKILADLQLVDQPHPVLDEHLMQQLPFPTELHKAAVLDLYRFELFKATEESKVRANEERADGADQDRIEEAFRFKEAQTLIHLPLDEFKHIVFRMAPGVVSIQANWHWNFLVHLTRRYNEWDHFFTNSRGETTISLKYKKDMGGFVEQSDDNWYFVMDTFRFQPACLQDFVDCLCESTDLASQLSVSDMEKNLFESIRTLAYWGFIEPC